MTIRRNDKVRLRQSGVQGTVRLVRYISPTCAIYHIQLDDGGIVKVWRADGLEVLKETP